MKKGISGEFSRFYTSVNIRDEAKIKNQLIHELIDDNVELDKIKGKLVSIVSKSNCRLEKNWMFDFDSLDEGLLSEFIESLMDFTREDSEDRIVDWFKTPNGYVVIINKHFDTRKLLRKYPFVELKRDDLLCID